MSKKLLTPEQVTMIRNMRAEVDGWGDPKWTGEHIADAVGVSPSTVWRVLKERAAYSLNKDQKATRQIEAGWAAIERDAFGVAERVDPRIDAAVAASQERLLAMLEGQGTKPALDGLVYSPDVLERAKEYGAGDRS